MRHSSHLVSRLVLGSTVDPDSGCFIWQGWMSGGYGMIRYDGRDMAVHRAILLALGVPIPEGVEVDHVRLRGCTSPACWNPDHLEVVTQRENSLRSDNFGGANARKTHCPQGHEYTAENTRLYRNQRFCRACARDRQRAKHQRTM